MAVAPPPYRDRDSFKPGLRFYLAFVAISSLTLAAAIDATSISIALPIITKDLNGSAYQAFWAGTSFQITSAIVMPIHASVSNIFGRKLMIFLSSLLFTAGCICGGLANNFDDLLVGRCIQGVGAGGCIVLGEIVITDLVPLNQRPKWLGWLGSMWTVGGLIGPLLGGVFAEFVTWRWIFWMLLPFIGIGAIMTQVYLKQEPIAGYIVAKVLRVDWIGAALFTTSCAGILVPLTWGGIQYSWTSVKTLVPIFLGVDVLLAFIYYEVYWAREPMIRRTIFSNWSLRSTYLQTFLHALVFWAMFYYLPLYYQMVRFFSPLIAGICMLPETLIASPFSVIIGVLIAMAGRYRWSLYMGWVFMLFGTGLLMVLDVHTSIAIFITINATASIGLGTLIPAMSFAIQAAVAQKDCSSAIAFYVFLRQFGEGIGVAVGGVIFQNGVKENLQSLPAFASNASEWSKDAVVLGNIIKATSPEEGQSDLLQAYVGALRAIWVVMCILSGAGFLACLIVKGYSLDQKLVTEQGYTGDRRSGHLELSEIEHV